MAEDANKSFTQIRRRKNNKESFNKKDLTQREHDTRACSGQDEPKVTHVGSLDPDTYWLTRVVLLRYIGFIYC